jgi:hypothetical protein
MNRPDILAAATQAVTKDRVALYGPPEQSFTQLAAIWSVRLGVDIRADQVAIMLIDLKTVRAWGNPNHPDSWVDMAGYAACGGEIGTEADMLPPQRPHNAPPAPVAHVAATHAAPDTEGGSTGRFEGCAHV